jgi:phosphoribosylformimino-5-aminoimidazole carboxamide ribotide isomerase
VILFPAIDLKDGKCVRLVRGAMDQATVYNEDAPAQACAFRDIGFTWLHIVDLDGAVAGAPRNAEAVNAILWAVGGAMRVQLGGGIRDRGAIDGWLDKEVDRIVLGTAAVRDPPLVRGAARDYPGRIAVGIDARGGKVAVEGWAETSAMTALDLARAFEDAGVAAIIYTDIDRDGVLSGINWETTLALAEAVSIPVIASGGLASLADVERLTRPDAAKLAGAITGRALYDGRIDPREALQMLGGDSFLPSPPGGRARSQ